ncbi:EF-Hand 1, calcium-binding site [Cinara cedri]|uniref:EF-Hand 1, calcium-binding site n=1 Tax=Cinara cedri TaxID=506608 RepID=A0A5E4MAR3_9HEMI|nr:EF-Hand 1, calcium-binding site [Cinara cedri]
MGDIARMLQELSDEEVGDDFEDFDSDSDLSDENIVYDNFDSDSEQNISDEEVEAMYTDELYYTGKDKVSKWRKTEFTQHSKTKKHDIIKTSSGLTSRSKNIEIRHAPARVIHSGAPAKRLRALFFVVKCRLYRSTPSKLYDKLPLLQLW